MTDTASPRLYRGTLKSEARIVMPVIAGLALLPLSCPLISSGHLTGWGYLELALAAGALFGGIAFLVRRPTLSVGPSGLRLQSLQYSWRYAWTDVQAIGEFQRSRGLKGPCLGLRLRADVKPQHRLGEAAGLAMYGYQAIIPDMWDAPLNAIKDQVLTFHEKAAGESNRIEQT